MADADLTQLQLLQQNMQNMAVQKQQFQKQLMEVDSALTEIGNTDKAYKILGNLMVAVDKQEMEKELKEKKEILSLRIKNFEKQEEKLKERSEELQKKVIDKMKKKNE